MAMIATIPQPPVVTPGRWGINHATCQTVLNCLCDYLILFDTLPPGGETQADREAGRVIPAVEWLSL